MYICIRSAVGELIADIFGSSDEEEEFEVHFAVVLNCNYNLGFYCLLLFVLAVHFVIIIIIILIIIIRKEDFS